MPSAERSFEQVREASPPSWDQLVPPRQGRSLLGDLWRHRVGDLEQCRPEFPPRSTRRASAACRRCTRRRTPGWGGSSTRRSCRRSSSPRGLDVSHRRRVSRRGSMSAGSPSRVRDPEARVVGAHTDAFRSARTGRERARPDHSRTDWASSGRRSTLASSHSGTPSLVRAREEGVGAALEWGPRWSADHEVPPPVGDRGGMRIDDDEHSPLACAREARARRGPRLERGLRGGHRSAYPTAVGRLTSEPAGRLPAAGGRELVAIAALTAGVAARVPALPESPGLQDSNAACGRARRAPGPSRGRRVPGAGGRVRVPPAVAPAAC